MHITKYSIAILIISCTTLISKPIYVINPIEHFAKSFSLQEADTIRYFEVDFNSDKKPDLFITSMGKTFTNGQMGKIYQLYISHSKGYLFKPDNSITAQYEKLIFNDNSYFKYHVPFIIVEEDSLWGCSYINDSIKEFKICDLKWGSHAHSAEIFSSILERDTSKIHPAITCSVKNATKMWK